MDQTLVVSKIYRSWDPEGKKQALGLSKWQITSRCTVEIGDPTVSERDKNLPLQKASE